ncbi:MAG: MaoC family dehydratase [Spongiibacteraceae bacterium]|nr:MaoC family dehydratase [Spongiibacteraceae bacterium]
MSTDRPRKFEDLTVGETRRSRGWQITEQEIFEFAKTYDPQPFHLDHDAARRSPFGGLIASGMQTLAISRRLDHDSNLDLDVYCGLGYDSLRLLAPVRPGDVLTLESTILELIPSASGKPRGRVVAVFKMFNQHDEVVMEARGSYLVHCRNK